MAEAIALVASIIAVVQASEAIIKICKGYIEGVQDYPSDLRRVLLEVSTLKDLFANLRFLHDTDSADSSPILNKLSDKDGPIEGCRLVVSQLEEEFSSMRPGCTSDLDPGPSTNNSAVRKKGKIRRAAKPTLARLAWPLRKHKVQTLLAEVTQYKATIALAFSTDLVQDMKAVKGKLKDISDTFDDTRKQGFRSWLQKTNPSSRHNAACELYEPGTGEWVCRLPEWSDWLNRKKHKRCLWIHGIPGAGKTVLFSKLVELVKSQCGEPSNQRIGTAYYYCYHARNQDEAAPFLRWVLGQLSLQADSVPEDIYGMYQGEFEPTLAQLLAAIEQILERFDLVFLSLDAIDESQPREDLLRVLSDLMTDHRFEKIQLLATSREYIDIEAEMNAISSPVSMAHSLVEEDIRLYVSTELSTKRPFKYWAPPLKTRIETALAKGAQGMFRWAVCQLDLLRRARLQTVEGIEIALRSLPKTLDETYERIFASVPGEDSDLLRIALLWMQFHIGFNFETDNIPLDVLIQILSRPLLNREPDEVAKENSVVWLRDVCGCLVRVTDSDGIATVSFAHYTVREFLVSDRITESLAASHFALHHTNVYQQCFPLILRNVPNKIIAEAWDPGLNTDVLVEYCFNFFLAFGDVELHMMDLFFLKDDNLRRILLDFLKSNRAVKNLRDFLNVWGSNPLKDMSESVWWPFIWEKDDDDDASDAMILFRIVSFGLRATAERFLEHRDLRPIFQRRIVANVDLPLGGWNPPGAKRIEGSIFDLFVCSLSWTDRVGPEFIVRIGAGYFDPSSALVLFAKNHLQNCLPCETFNTVGQCALMQLIYQGADPDCPDLPITALQVAAIGGDLKAAEVLIGAGAEPNMIGTGLISDKEEHIYKAIGKFRKYTPLQLCRLSALASAGEVIPLLLEAGARDLPLEVTLAERLEMAELIGSMRAKVGSETLAKLLENWEWLSSGQNKVGISLFWDIMGRRKWGYEVRINDRARGN
ncbi:Fc.00g080490.m01.CDS01 [Cosmosporella sp. VM-42]